MNSGNISRESMLPSLPVFKERESDRFLVSAIKKKLEKEEQDDQGQ